MQNYPTGIDTIGYGNTHPTFPLKLINFKRKNPSPEDVVIAVVFCGVCHSDWHVIRNEWNNSKYPIIVGHEVTGYIVKIGNNVTKFKINDKVAIGPNYNSCLKCDQCVQGNEQYCLNDVTEIYNMPDRKPGELKPTGPITQGGYSNIIVAHQHFVLKIPDFAPMDKISPVLCAGATMYTPLKELKIGSGKRVGIAGIGGLGHIGIKLAKSFGAEVIALTHTPEKLLTAQSLGANKILLISDQDKLMAFESYFDLIIDTIPFNHDLIPYINLIKPNSTLWIVGSFFTMSVDFNKINRKGRIIRGSSTASIAGTQEVINYCADNNIYPDIEKIAIQNINNTHENLLKSKVRYRYVIDMKTLKN